MVQWVFRSMRARSPLRSRPSSQVTLAVVVLTAGLPAACQRARANPKDRAASPASAAPIRRAAAPAELAGAALPVSDPVQRPEDGCPPEMVARDGYCIDRWEAHLVEWVGNERRNHPHNARPAAGTRYEARSERGVFPQAYISRDEAAAACSNAGKRLCTAKEWYSACSDPDGRTYPYGVRYVARACNVSKSHLLTRYYGPDPRGWRYDENFNDPRLDVEPGFLAKTGEYDQCVSASGVADMVGNLHEWVSDRVDRGLPRKFPLIATLLRTVPRNGGHGVFLGGFFSTSHEHGYGCRFATLAHEPAYHDYSTGFRCCRDVSAARGDVPLLPR